MTPERQGYQVLTPFGKLGYSHKKEKHGRDTAHRVDQTSSDQEHVDERDGGEDPVPETQSEFIMREQARKSP